ncbi:MAG: D-alanine--D-alanine ligase [Deltaproteobacteria bacterium]|nr:D-alanine--D-alanine ligase [Deltaproteobacteria bacterium]
MGKGRRRIGVLMGGMSAERDVSLRTGDAVAAALAGRGHEVVKVFVDRDLDRILRQSAIDVAFLALHGRYGEDGCVQGLLEIMGIPYTGSGVLASALAMDKLKAKELFRLHNISTAPYYVIDARRLADIEDVHGSFGFPVIVKPRREGSSIGVTRADDPQELARAAEAALQFDSEALVERFITGKEVAVAVLDGRVLGGIEIVPKKGFYDYQSKYQKGMSEYHFPARLGPTRYRGVLNLGEAAHRALGCSGATRVDLIVTEGENEYVLEVNTLPGMTPTSLLPKIAAGAGMDFGDLCEAILGSARLHAANRVEAELEEEGATAGADPAEKLAV